MNQDGIIYEMTGEENKAKIGAEVRKMQNNTVVCIMRMTVLIFTRKWI